MVARILSVVPSILLSVYLHWNNPISYPPFVQYKKIDSYINISLVITELMSIFVYLFMKVYKAFTKKNNYNG